MAEIGITNYQFIEPIKVDKEDPNFPTLNKSHLSLNRTIQERIFPRVTTPQFIVFEDDLMTMVPPHEIIGRLNNIIREVPAEWDMVYLEYCMEMCPLLTQKVSNNLHKAFKPYCTAGVLYRTQSIPKFKTCMQMEKAQVDFAYVSCIRKKQLQAYIAQPPLFAQDVTMQSDLNHLHPSHIQYYVNMFIRMYDENARRSMPRLPHCATPRHLAPYIRWFNVFFILVGFFALLISIVLITRHYVKNLL